MSEKDLELLENAGWTVECESPFEISTKDGSFASGEGAHIVLAYLRQESKYDCSDLYRKITERLKNSLPLSDNSKYRQLPVSLKKQLRQLFDRESASD